MLKAGRCNTGHCGIQTMEQGCHDVVEPACFAIQVCVDQLLSLASGLWPHVYLNGYVISMFTSGCCFKQQAFRRLRLAPKWIKLLFHQCKLNRRLRFLAFPPHPQLLKKLIPAYPWQSMILAQLHSAHEQLILPRLLRIVNVPCQCSKVGTSISFAGHKGLHIGCRTAGYPVQHFP